MESLMKALLWKPCGRFEQGPTGSNILGMFSGITPSKYPVCIPPVRMIGELELEPGEVGGSRAITVRMIHEDGTVLREIHGDVAFDNPSNGLPPRSWLDVEIGMGPMIGGPGVFSYELLDEHGLLARERVIMRPTFGTSSS